MKGEGSGKAFGGGERVLIAVEGEKDVGFQLQGRSDVFPAVNLPSSA